MAHMYDTHILDQLVEVYQLIYRMTQKSDFENSTLWGHFLDARQFAYSHGSHIRDQLVIGYRLIYSMALNSDFEISTFFGRFFNTWNSWNNSRVVIVINSLTIGMSIINDPKLYKMVQIYKIKLKWIKVDKNFKKSL